MAALRAQPIELPTIGPAARCPVTAPREVMRGSNVEGQGIDQIFVRDMWPVASWQDGTFVDGRRYIDANFLRIPGSSPGYLIRGADARTGDAVLFTFQGSETSDELWLLSQWATDAPELPPDFEEWQAGIGLLAPGCYALQIDTVNAGWVVVFEAI